MGNNYNRTSFSYRFNRWFWSNHTEEIKFVFEIIGGFLMTLAMFGIIFFIPHFFH